MRLCASLLCTALAAAAGEPVVVYVTYESLDGTYADGGASAGLREGDVGSVIRNGAEVGRVEVAAASARWARLRPVSGEAPRPGDVVSFSGARRPAGEEAHEALRADLEREFVPLLERQRHVHRSSQGNLFHGRAELRHLFQSGSEPDLDFHRTSLSFAATVDRFRGGSWALETRGRLEWRGGDAFSGSDLDGLRASLFELHATRPLATDGLLRLGRFHSRALPGLGRFDGAQVDAPLGAGWRGGAILGFVPDRADLDPSFQEPGAAVYAALSGGTRVRYDGAFGLVATLFDGELDRRSFLADQRLEIGSRVVLGASAEVDLEGSIPRANLFANARVLDHLTLRAGFDRFDPFDTEAERDARGLPPGFEPADADFDRAYAGFSYALAAGFALHGEAALLDDDVRWRATVSHATARTAISLTAFDLKGRNLDGFGLLLAGRASLGRLELAPSATWRDFGGASFADARLDAHVRLDRRWTLSASAAHAFGDDLDATSVEIAVRFRW